MLLRLSTLATGRTGVRPEVAQAYAGVLSTGLTPIVYEYGSLGCSGEPAPLAPSHSRSWGIILALTDLDRLLVLADIAAAMSVEGLLGTDRVFAPHLHALRPQPDYRRGSGATSRPMSSRTDSANAMSPRRSRSSSLCGSTAASASVSPTTPLNWSSSPR